jgi:putative (di)nucleoside polyphosphate hydrolase
VKLPDNVFRANVGAVVINREGLVLALERSDIKDAWQLPQGGLKEGEEPLDGVRRELCEETTISSHQVEALAELAEWLAYELPKEQRTRKHGRGQVQKWFLFRFVGDDSEIDLSCAEAREFSRWRWMKMEEICQRTVTFRRPIYERIAKEFAAYFA